jgi:hypothetical protein
MPCACLGLYKLQYLRYCLSISLSLSLCVLNKEFFMTVLFIFGLNLENYKLGNWIVTLVGEYILGTRYDNSFSKVICGLDGWAVIPSRGGEIFLLIHT